MGHQLKQLVVLQMFVGVFIPWGQMETFTVGGLLLALVIAIVNWWLASWLSRCSKTAWPVCVLILLRALPGPGLALHF